MLRTSSSSSLKPAKVMPTRAEDYELIEEIGQGVSAKARAFTDPGFTLCADATPEALLPFLYDHNRARRSGKQGASL